MPIQQLWGASVAAQSETEDRKKQGEAALEEGNDWFISLCRGRVKKLPRFLRDILRHAPTHAW